MEENVFAGPAEYYQLFDFDMNPTTTKYGVCKLKLMVHFMAVIETKLSKVKGNFTRFKSFIVSQIKRGITPEEEKNLLEGIHNYLKSDQATNERMAAMDYIFELKFLND